MYYIIWKAFKMNAEKSRQIVETEVFAMIISAAK